MNLLKQQRQYILIVLAVLMPGIYSFAQTGNLFNSSGNLKSPKELYHFGQYQYKGPVQSFTKQKESSQSLGSGGPVIHYPKSQVFKGENGKIGYADWEEKILIPAIYDEMGEYSELKEGSNQVWVKLNGKYGIIEYYQRTPVVPIKYDEMKKISILYVWVKLNGKVGVLSLRGGKTSTSRISVPIKYDDMWLLGKSHGLWVRMGEKYGVISVFGDKTLDIEYQDLIDYSMMLIQVKKDNKWGLMNNRGETVLPIAYDKIMPDQYNVSWILQGGKWGLISNDGKILITPQYDKLYMQDKRQIWINNMAIVSKQGKLFYINTYGKENIDEAVSLSPNTIEITVSADEVASVKNGNSINEEKSNSNYDPIQTFNQSRIKEFEPKDEIEFSKRAGNKMDKKDYSGAISDYNRAIGINPNYEMLFYNRGTAKVYLDQNRDAIEDFNKAIKMNPEYKAAYINRALAKATIEDYTGAIADFTKVVELDPTYVSGYYEIGNLKRKTEDFAGAIEAYDKVVILVTDDANTYFFRGLAKCKTQDYKGGIIDFAKAIELNPQFGDAFYNRGLANFMNYDETAACEDLRRAAALDYAGASDAVKKFCK